MFKITKTQLAKLIETSAKNQLFTIFAGRFWRDKDHQNLREMMILLVFVSPKPARGSYERARLEESGKGHVSKARSVSHFILLFLYELDCKLKSSIQAAITVLKAYLFS